MSLVAGGHTLKKYDEDLATLRDLVIKMGAGVEEQLRLGMRALEQRDMELAERVVEGDREIDRYELRADEEIAQLIALRAPLGVDLRTILTLSKTVNDLERIGDESKKLAKIAQRLMDASGDRVEVPMVAEIGGLSKISASMLRGALDALVRLDLQQAERTRRDDDRLDKAYKASVGQLTQLMSESPAAVAAGVQALFALKSLERIGDHAKNIAGYVFYLVEGRDVRHPKARLAADASRP
ncbi:phosphate signaling complex protein PhoU [uncultured Aquimonas sp.]|uniref:phosphate signaling complex protein PhoU n=1 Tax=uncultured Aquimonas sp. TaxID=385483 RepID=UPI00086AC736|nr:phosphate signaling complex protein PhoU [uncultured Aquimonas sp.]ODU44908.1 MAG: phosphate transport system regulatory protein PhoU [Xanthomonadaceae bacterium SCN 69-123]